MTNSSESVFERAVLDKTRDLDEELAKLTSAIASCNKDRIIGQVRTTSAKALVLTEILAESARPVWLVELTGALTLCDRNQCNHSCLEQLLTSLGLNHRRMQGHKWAFLSEDDGLALNIDQMYQEALDVSQVPELFDKLVGLLEELLASGEIDSKQLDNAIKRLIATLRASRNGSYLSVLMSWSLASKVLRNFVLKQLDHVSPLKDLRESISKALDDVGVGIEDLKAEFSRRSRAMMDKLEPRISAITYPTLTDDQKQGAIDSAFLDVGDERDGAP